jgi:heme-binding NEAT domain protein
MESLDGVSRAQQVAELAAKQQRIVELGTRIAEKLSAGSGPDVSQPSGTPAPAEPTPETPKNDDVGEQPRSTEESDRKEVKP